MILRFASTRCKSWKASRQFHLDNFVVLPLEWEEVREGDSEEGADDEAQDQKKDP